MKKRAIKKRVVRRNESFFARNYRDSWNYLKESKMFIFYIIGLFLLFTLIGYFVSPPVVLEQALENLILELIEKTQGMNQQEIIVFIFLNNVQSAFLGMIFGILLGIFSVFTTIFNGYLIGFVSQKVVEVESPLILLKLFPHGIFELPAIFISLGLGLRLGDKFVEKIFRVKSFALRVLLILLLSILGILVLVPLYLFNQTIAEFVLVILVLLTLVFFFINKSLRLAFYNSLKVFLFIVVPLLIIAAIIEGSLIAIFG